MARLTIHQAAVAKVNVDPVGSAVTVGALTRIVVGWRMFAVAPSTVQKNTVRKSPIAGAVTVGALAGVVIGFAVAARTIACAAVREPPATGVMAVGALARVVAGFFVAARTVAESRVVEPDLGPVADIVAVGALASIMIDCGMAFVTIETVFRLDVVKPDNAPVDGVVTIGALALVVSLGQLVTRLAVPEASMVERHLFPVGDVVAIRALSGIVIIRRVIPEVARLAVGGVNVLVGDNLPIGDIGVAVYTGTEIQRATKSSPRQTGFVLR
jgi:hypothetical protein